MDTIVTKFGGSSTADAAMLRRVGAILRANPARRCAVLSAPGGIPKTTDLLAECARLCAAGQAMDRPMRIILGRFAGIAAGLGLPDCRSSVHREIASAAEVSIDAAMSRGEAICARMFARWINWPYLDAADVVRFDDAGALDVPGTLSLLRGAAQSFHRFVLPGFYGADGQGRIRTLPRNGSDITGALAAAALDASLYENWTDVPGLMTADPAAVRDARPVPRISYRQMAALAEAGAKVLHPDCLAPVDRAGIPTRLRCTMHPELPGTRIDGDYQACIPCVVGRVPGDAARAMLNVFGANAAMRQRLVRALSGGLVSESEWIHCFLTDPARLTEDLRAAHRILYP